MLFTPRNIKITLAVIAVVSAGLVVILFRSSTEKVLASGQFHPVAHRGIGTVNIVTVGGTRKLKFENFRTSSRPGLMVLLISAPDAFENEAVKKAERFEVGPLISTEGDLEYELPASMDLNKFNAVSIWNPEYGVNYATAPLNKRQEISK